MKTFLFLFPLLASLLLPEPAHAVTSSGYQIRILFSSGAGQLASGADNPNCVNCGVTTVSTWKDLSASLPKAIKGVSLYNTSQVPFQLAIGASGAEVVQMVIPAGHNNDGQAISLNMNAGNSFYPIALSQGTKVSIRALNSSATGGELDGTFYSY